MGNTKGKMTVQGEEVNVGKEVPNVAAEDKAATGEGASDAHAITPETTDHKPDSSANGHATATGEEPVVNAAAVEDKAKDDTIEECPTNAAANDSTALADTTTDSNATTDSATKSKKKESKPLVWLKQVKKHVSFNKKKKPVVEKKAEDNAQIEEVAAAEEPIVKEDGDVVENNVTETEHHHHVDESPNNVDVTATTIVEVPVVTETPKEDPVENSAPPAATTVTPAEIPASTPSIVEEPRPVHDHVSSSNENTTTVSESHDAASSLE